MFKNKPVQVFLLTIILGSIALPVFAQPYDPNFNPNNLISDALFSDTQTFSGPDGIQNFLAQKGSVLADTDPTFLQKLKEPQITLLKQALNDPNQV